MQLKTILVAPIVLLFAGCASQNYQLYAETQRAIAQANAVVEAARYNALQEIAKTGDTAAKVAAVMSIQMGSGNNRPQQHINPPEDWSDKALKWAGIILPSATQLYGIHANRQIAITQSNNQAAVAQSTNQTFGQMSTNMANSNTNIAQSGFTALNSAGTTMANIANSGLTTASNLGTAGITGINQTAVSALTATTNVANNGFTGITNTAANGFTGITNTAANGLTATTNVSRDSNSTIQALGTQSVTNINNLTQANRSIIENLASKLTGTTTTTTTTNTTTTNPSN